MKNESLNKISQLAESLGTNPESIVAVLAEQAPIYAIFGLLKILAVICFGYILFKLNKRFHKPDEKGFSVYEESDVALIGMLLSFVCFLALCAYIIYSMDSFFIAYTNPEYWALKQILKAM